MKKYGMPKNNHLRRLVASIKPLLPDSVFDAPRSLPHFPGTSIAKVRGAIV